MYETALDKKTARAVLCDYSHISWIFKDFHYKGSVIGGGITACFAMFIGDKMSGGSILGLPRHQEKYPNHLDIRRMACIDSAPHNSESWFLSQVIKWAASNTGKTKILSYSDLSVGHTGTIYRAANFKKIGETSPTKNILWDGRTYHMRSLTIDRPYSKKIQNAIANGFASIETGSPKIIWEYSVSRKMSRKVFALKRIEALNQIELFA